MSTADELGHDPEGGVDVAGSERSVRRDGRHDCPTCSLSPLKPGSTNCIAWWGRQVNRLESVAEQDGRSPVHDQCGGVTRLRGARIIPAGPGPEPVCRPGTAPSHAPQGRSEAGPSRPGRNALDSPRSWPDNAHHPGVTTSCCVPRLARLIDHDAKHRAKWSLHTSGMWPSFGSNAQHGPCLRHLRQGP